MQLISPAGGVSASGKVFERDVINMHLVTSTDAVHWDLQSVYQDHRLVNRGGIGSWDTGMTLAGTELVPSAAPSPSLEPLSAFCSRSTTRDTTQFVLMGSTRLPCCCHHQLSS